MKSVTNCSLTNAAFAFFTLKNKGYFANHIQKMLTKGSLYYGYSLIPKLVARFLRQFIGQGEAYLGKDRLEFIIFRYDLNVVPESDREDYVSECQDRIIVRALQSHAVVWVFAPPQLLNALAGTFNEGGANVYCHEGELPNEEVHAFLSQDPESEEYFPKAFYVHEKQLFNQDQARFYFRQSPN